MLLDNSDLQRAKVWRTLSPPRSPSLPPKIGGGQNRAKKAREQRALLRSHPSVFRSEPEKNRARAFSRHFSLVATFVVRFSSSFAAEVNRKDTSREMKCLPL